MATFSALAQRVAWVAVDVGVDVDGALAPATPATPSANVPETAAAAMSSANHDELLDSPLPS